MVNLYINLERNEYKFDTLCDLYEAFTIAQTIIYCNSRKMVESLYRKLEPQVKEVTQI